MIKAIYTFLAKPFLNDAYSYAIEYDKEELIQRLKYMHNNKSKYTELELHFDPPTRENPGINFEIAFKRRFFAQQHYNDSLLMGHTTDNPLTVNILIGSEMPQRIVAAGLWFIFFPVALYVLFSQGEFFPILFIALFFSIFSYQLKRSREIIKIEFEKMLLLFPIDKMTA